MNFRGFSVLMGVSVGNSNLCMVVAGGIETKSVSGAFHCQLQTSQLLCLGGVNDVFQVSLRSLELGFKPLFPW